MPPRERLPAAFDFGHDEDDDDDGDARAQLQRPRVSSRPAASHEQLKPNTYIATCDSSSDDSDDGLGCPHCGGKRGQACLAAPRFAPAAQTPKPAEVAQQSENKAAAPRAAATKAAGATATAATAAPTAAATEMPKARTSAGPAAAAAASAPQPTRASVIDYSKWDDLDSDAENDSEDERKSAPPASTAASTAAAVSTAAAALTSRSSSSSASSPNPAAAAAGRGSTATAAGGAKEKRHKNQAAAPVVDDVAVQQRKDAELFIKAARDEVPPHLLLDALRRVTRVELPYHLSRLLIAIRKEAAVNLDTILEQFFLDRKFLCQMVRPQNQYFIEIALSNPNPSVPLAALVCHGALLTHKVVNALAKNTQLCKSVSMNCSSHGVVTCVYKSNGKHEIFSCNCGEEGYKAGADKCNEQYGEAYTTLIRKLVLDEKKHKNFEVLNKIIDFAWSKTGLGAHLMPVLAACVKNDEEYAIQRIVTHKGLSPHFAGMLLFIAIKASAVGTARALLSSCTSVPEESQTAASAGSASEKKPLVRSEIANYKGSISSGLVLTPLLAALEQTPKLAEQQLEMLELLIEFGADVDAEVQHPTRGKISFQCILSERKFPAKVVKLLIANTKRDKAKVRNELDWIDTQRLLTDAVLKIDAPRVRDLLTKSVATDWPSASPALVEAIVEGAAKEGFAPIVAALLRADFPTELTISGGVTMAHRAATANRADVVSALLSRDAACLRCTTARGDSPLHAAAEASSVEALRAMLATDEGLRRLAITNSQGKTPLDMVDKSRKSASAAAAKQLRAMITEAQAQAKRLGPDGATRKPLGAFSAPVVNSANSESRSAAGAEKQEGNASRVRGENEPVPVVVESPAERLRKEILGCSAFTTRERLIAEIGAAVPQYQESIGSAAIEALLRDDLDAFMAAVCAHPFISRVGQFYEEMSAQPSLPLSSAYCLRDSRGAQLRQFGVVAGDSLFDAARKAPGRARFVEQLRARYPRVPALLAPPPVEEVAADDDDVDASAAISAAAFSAAVGSFSAASALAASERRARHDHALSRVDDAFEDLPWRVLIVRSAAKDLSALDVQAKQAALAALVRIASGVWSGHSVKHLSGSGIPKHLSLYESKFSKGSRIIWSVGIDFIPLVRLYQQTIRVWAVDLSHDVAQRSIERVCAIHRRGLSSVISRKLRARVHRVAGSELVLPKSYEVAPEGVISISEAEEQLSARSRGGDEGQSSPLDDASAPEFENGEEYVRRFPPAVEQEDAYNLVKFYSLDRSLIYNIVAATFSDKLEFPFLPDEVEHLIISLSERRSVLLIGRSGTGKTTIVVQRMWLKYRLCMEQLLLSLDRSEKTLVGPIKPPSAAPAAGEIAHPASGAPEIESPGISDGQLVVAGDAAQRADEPDTEEAALSQRRLHQIFVTANPILRSSVLKSFKSLQSGWLQSLGADASKLLRRWDARAAEDRPKDELEENEEQKREAKEAATVDTYLSLNDVPESAWPLFLRAHNWLRLVDATLPQEMRFFSAAERAAAAGNEASWHADQGGLDELPSIGLDGDDDDDDDDDDGEEGEEDEDDGEEDEDEGEDDDDDDDDDDELDDDELDDDELDEEESEEEEAPVPAPSGKKRKLAEALPTPPPAKKKQVAPSTPAATPGKKQATPAAKTPGTAATPGASNWTAAEEAALRKAVAATSATTPNRWAEVASKVGGGKTKDACKKHFKDLSK